MEAARLETQEAVLLAHALLSRLAEDVQARVLFIKGPTAVAVGARPVRGSSDVDALVEPTAFRKVCQALERCGWSLRTPLEPVRNGSGLALEHSAHYLHPDWPCDIDVHYLFPGFLAPPAQVFDRLWERRITVTLAGREVSSPDVLGQSLVVALHALRDLASAHGRHDLEHLTGVLQGAGGERVRELVALADATGAVDTARPLLTTLTCELPAPHRSTGLSDWEFRQRTMGVPGSLWLGELRRAGWRGRGSLLRQAVLPPRELMLSSHLATGATRRQVLGLHLTRWRRGLRALPQALRSSRLDRRRR